MTTGDKGAKQAEKRCADCRWIHESDSVAQTSFRGVGLCERHEAFDELLEASKKAYQMLARFMPNTADVVDQTHYFSLRNAIEKAEGRTV